MIYVEKPRTSIPQPFSGKAANELPKVLKHYSRAKTRDTVYDFGAYKCRSVRDALDAIFNYRCAYCESFYKGAFSAHVDHWRPKGSILKDKKRYSPGYYWLAADWDNLFPTCQYCNTPNKVELMDGTRETLGKWDQFPIAKPRRSGAKQGDELTEGPLLLNPSADDPTKHMVFCKAQGLWGHVAPRRDGTGQASRKGTVSIKVYALQRKDLVEVRKEKLTQLKADLVDLELEARALVKSPKDRGQVKKLARVVDRIARNWFGPTAGFVGMSRQFVVPVLRRLSANKNLRPIMQRMNQVLPANLAI